MCDTLCAIRNWSKNGAVIFAKNSDRSPNEPHLVIRVREKNYSAGSEVKLTYITIGQAEHTLEAILCKPSWTWGAEMGVNSASVAIGNEAVFTKAGRGPEALTGMDLVRLALERSDSAQRAVACITDLLEKYGQGGNCGFDHEFYYDNSFLIADPAEGYILETSGRKWAVSKIKDYQAISNRLSIHKEHSMRGGVEEGFDFTGKLTEPVYTYFSGSRQRRSLSLSALSSPMDAEQMMKALRQHNFSDASRVFTHGSVRSVCMHAGGIVGDHTTGSMIAELRKDKPATIWCTAASTPCISAFKPVFLSCDSGAPVFEEEAEAKRYWLERERLHRAVLAGKVDVAALQLQRDTLEIQWLMEEQGLFALDAPDKEALESFARKAAAQEQAMVNEFMPKDGFAMHGHRRFDRYWRSRNAALGK